VLGDDMQDVRAVDVGWVRAARHRDHGRHPTRRPVPVPTLTQADLEALWEAAERGRVILDRLDADHDLDPTTLVTLHRLLGRVQELAGAARG
jgi:hypothetical protein